MRHPPDSCCAAKLPAFAAEGYFGGVGASQSSRGSPTGLRVKRQLRKKALSLLLWRGDAAWRCDSAAAFVGEPHGELPQVAVVDNLHNQQAPFSARPHN